MVEFLPLEALLYPILSHLAKANILRLDIISNVLSSPLVLLLLEATYLDTYLQYIQLSNLYHLVARTQIKALACKALSIDDNLVVDPGVRKNPPKMSNQYQIRNHSFL